MRKFAALAAALLAACTTAQPQMPGHICKATGVDHFIGRAATSETAAEIIQTTHATVLRWAPPGYMLTMDYRVDRVTVWLGPDRKITQIKCG
jgi:hypothetical protein